MKIDYPLESLPMTPAAVDTSKITGSSTPKSLNNYKLFFHYKSLLQKYSECVSVCCLFWLSP